MDPHQQKSKVQLSTENRGGIGRELYSAIAFIILALLVVSESPALNLLLFFTMPVATYFRLRQLFDRPGIKILGLFTLASMVPILQIFLAVHLGVSRDRPDTVVNGSLGENQTAFSTSKLSPLVFGGAFCVIVIVAFFFLKRQSVHEVNYAETKSAAYLKSQSKLRVIQESPGAGPTVLPGVIYTAAVDIKSKKGKALFSQHVKCGFFHKYANFELGCHYGGLDFAVDSLAVGGSREVEFTKGNAWSGNNRLKGVQLPENETVFVKARLIEVCDPKYISLGRGGLIGPISTSCY